MTNYQVVERTYIGANFGQVDESIVTLDCLLWLNEGDIVLEYTSHGFLPSNVAK